MTQIAHTTGTIDRPQISESRATVATRMDRLLREQVMPYWYDRALDHANGGYKLADKHHSARTLLRGVQRRLKLWSRKYLLRNPYIAMEKQAASQARAMYGFCLAHRLGYSDSTRNYLDGAALGYRFIKQRLFDRDYGGVYWRADVAGRILDSKKLLVAQLMTIYAFVEYYRAAGLDEPLDDALALFRLVNAKLHDDVHGGWFEHAERDWSPLLKGSGTGPMTVGMKSGVVHLHIVEALGELWETTRDDAVHAALEEAMEICVTTLYPRDAARAREYCTLDWQKVDGPRYGPINYGHNLAAAWFLARAREVLGQSPDWEHFDGLATHALEYGFDHARGGVYFKGEDNLPASDRTKLWGVQGEGLAALSVGLQRGPHPQYERALDLLLDWIWNYQMSPNGVWILSTNESGEPLDATLAGTWKEPYHDLRAMTMFVRTFRRSN